MSGEMIVVNGTTKTLVSSGASLANNTMSAASAATYDRAADGGDFPDAALVLAVAYGTAPTVNTTLDLYARELDIDGTGDAVAPTTTYKRRHIASFPVINQTAMQYIKALAFDLPKLAEYYLHNNATGQTISAGWKLKITPRSYKPAP